MRINLGSCDLPLPQSEGWINVDRSTSEHIKCDVVADVMTELDDYFAKECADEVYAGHLFEHIPYPEAENTLRYWISFLKPGGKIAITTPDSKYLAKAYLSGEISIEKLNDVYIFSYCQEDIHKSMWDADSLIKLFHKVGLKEVKEMDRNGDSRLVMGVPWQVIVEGTK
jgi:predicted SAM-dependent methyltransferase